jgi:hypothetical protein
VSKKITPVFLIYSNSIFNLYEYEFQDPQNYNSLVLVKQKNYSIESIEITLNEIVEVLNRVCYVDDPEMAFPQADSLKRIMNLCELLLQESLKKDYITLNYDFDSRQTNYYTDAGRYLGLIDKNRENGEIVFSLTDEGHRIMCSKYKIRQLKFVELILKHRVFAETLKLYLQQYEMPSKNKIVQIMKECNLYQIQADSTYNRRASTIASWINWILDLQR